MSKAVNEEPTVVAPHDFGLAASVVDAFKWIGECFADESIWVGKHLSNGHNDPGDRTRGPNAAAVRLGAAQRPSALPRSIGMPDLAESCSASVWSCCSRISLAALPSASALAGFGFFDSLSLVLPQSRYDDCGIDCLALENLRRAFRHILCERRLDDGRAFKAETLAISHGAIHQRPVEQLSSAANKVPT